jgi:predicted acyl esterase
MDADLAPDQFEHSDIRDGMQITWQAPIVMTDGNVLRCDVFRPVGAPSCPVLLSMGIYGKGLSFQEAYKPQWDKMVADYPEVATGTSAKYMNWETADPEKWVPHGYAVVRVDSRGSGWSPGFLDPESPQETSDLYDCIEWAAAQPWCSGKVGLQGISYYAFNQWRVAALQPPHLTAIVPWEGRADAYRDALYHGGIYCDFKSKWLGVQVRSVQFGMGERGRRNPNTGEPVAGPLTWSDEELAQNRVDRVAEIKAHPLYDGWHQAVNPDWTKVVVPMLSAANWGGQGLHPRGNFEGFTQSASKQKWLEVHGDAHWVHFYTNYGLKLQREFFDHFLRDIDNGWDQRPAVQLNVRHPDSTFSVRMEQEWPLATTRWTRLYLDAESRTLDEELPRADASVEYDPTGDGVTFNWPAVTAATEITGPIVAKLFVSSATVDADLFLVVSAYTPAGEEITFMGALDPNTPVANGWLRASHRKLDPAKTSPHRPYHSHDEVQPLTEGQVYELDIEIWPTCIRLPPGYSIALNVRGKDYEYRGEVDEFARNFVYAGRGVGPFTHRDPEMRPPEIFSGAVTIHSGPSYPSHLVLPVIP